MGTPTSGPEHQGSSPVRVVWGNPEVSTPTPVNWEEIVARAYVSAWLPLIKEAREQGKSTVEVHAGNPHTERGRSFFTASEQFLKKQEVKFITAEVPPVKDGGRWRLTITFML